MIYIGIDNGLKGCVCIMDSDVKFYDMPVLEVSINKKNRHVYNLICIKYIFRHIEQRIHEGAHAVIEAVRALPKQSSQSGLSIGYGHGILIGMLVAYGIPYEIVQVRTWQKEFNIYGKGKETKNKAYQVASQMYPELELTTPRGRIIDGRCDALLMAEYCKRIKQT